MGLAWRGYTWELQRTAAFLAALALAGCGGGQLAGASADKDAQTFAAKPGMGRLYLIQGYVTVGTVNHPSGETVPGTKTVYYYDKHDTPNPGGIGLLTAIAGGPLAGIMAGVEAANGAAIKEKPDRETRIHLTYKYFLNDKYVGDIGSKQYMALDLIPGTYRLLFKQPAGTSSMALVDLHAGEIEFLLANVAKYGSMGAYWEKCADDCEALIREDHRVTADLSGIEGPAPTPGSTPPVADGH